MSYTQELVGGYPHPISPYTPGVQSTGGGSYVLPPQDVQPSSRGMPSLTRRHGQNTTGATGRIYDQQNTGATPGMIATEGAAATTAGAVVGQQYTSPTVTSFAVSKKKLSVSKGDWTITDHNGHKVFKVDARVASMRDRRFLRDALGNKVLTMKKKLVSMHDSWEILAGDSGKVIATVRKSSLVQFRTGMDVKLANSNTGRHTPDYRIKGDYFNRNLSVFRGSEQVALVTRHLTFTSAILHKDVFGVTVFPGVDQALILALVVIVDEVFLHDNDGDE